MQQTMKRDRRMNVGPKERGASVLSGVAMIVAAVSRPSRLSFPLAVSGGYMLYRGLSGNCLVYEAMDISRTSQGSDQGIAVDRAMTINKPRAEVYRFWRNFENLPSFMQHLEAVHVTGPKTSHWVAKAPLDQKVEWDAEITEERENERIAWRSLPDSMVANSGLVRFADAPAGRGTEVHIHLRYDPPGGSAAAAFAKLFGEEPGRQVREDLRRFKQIIETGEAATITGQTSGRAKQTEDDREQMFTHKRKDVVQKASEDSFPASDPPAWVVSD